MILTCVTVSLVEQARGGPFVYWDDFYFACERAAELGFDAVELFAPEAEAVPSEEILGSLEMHGLQLAAVGTGAGWVINKWQLCDPDAERREQAKAFIRSMIDYGGPFGAPAIIGSMQGRFGGAVNRETAFGYLSEALEELGEYAAQYDIPLIYEPLNRYETNLVNTVADGVALLESLSTKNVKLLADLFHMNIEERNIADALRQGRDHIDHLHFVDSNRQPAGQGHMDYGPIVAALEEIGYAGYVSAEALPIPDSETAAELTINAYRRLLGC